MPANPWNTWLFQNVTTDLRCYKMPFCFILFTAFSPPDKRRQSPGTHTVHDSCARGWFWQRTMAKQERVLVLVSWQWSGGSISILDCWEFWVMAVFSQAPLWLTFNGCNKHQHATDAVETLQSISLPVVVRVIHLHQSLPAWKYRAQLRRCVWVSHRPYLN